MCSMQAENGQGLGVWLLEAIRNPNWIAWRTTTDRHQDDCDDQQTTVGYASSLSSSAFAFLRSGVSKPSVKEM